MKEAAVITSTHLAKNLSDVLNRVHYQGSSYVVERNVATDPAHIEHLRKFCAHIEVIRVPRWRILLKLATAIFSRLPFQVAYFHHRSAQRIIDRVITGRDELA